jgi:Flp pilus assembly protein TadD
VASRRSAEPPATPTRTLRAVARPRLAIKDGRDELEAGLLALEAGSARTALDWLRRATFRDPDSAVAQFALAKAYADTGDRLRAHAALLHTRRLLAALAGDGLVPGSDSMSVDSLRQAVHTFLDGLAA